MRLRGLLLLPACLLATACGGGPEAAKQAPASAPTAAALSEAVTTPSIVAHLRELEAIARAHGGNRAAGEPGGERTLDRLASRLRQAGYAVREQTVPFPFFEERSEPEVELEDGRPVRPIGTLEYSNGGDVRGPLVEVRGLGCAAADFEAVDRGEVALVRRGTCTLRGKALRAQAAGAVAALIVNDEPGTFPATVGSPGVRIPVVGTSPEAGSTLRAAAGTRVRVNVDAVSEERTTRNVIAETRTGARAGTVMLGAHADSVGQGPGINDNGTGVATLLTLAERLAEHAPTDRRVRFGFWGAEELGLYGSRRYVAGLTSAQRRELGAYVNLDMTGSPNPLRLVYDGDDDDAPDGSKRIETVLRDHFRGRRLPTGETSIDAASDHAPFARAGIPVGGLYSGAAERMTRAQAQRFGGRAGRPLDPCYHQACDTLDNVDERILGEMADATAHAAAVLAAR